MSADDNKMQESWTLNSEDSRYLSSNVRLLYEAVDCSSENTPNQAYVNPLNLNRKGKYDLRVQVGGNRIPTITRINV